MEVNKIYNMDCIDGMRQMIKDKMVADVVVTSPPYNMGKDYISYDDKLDSDKYLEKIEKVSLSLAKLIDDRGSVFVNLSGKQKDSKLPLETGLYFANNFNLQNMIIWVKEIEIYSKHYGRSRNINSEHYIDNSHEYIFHLTKQGGITTINRKAIGCNGSTWFIERDKPHSYGKMAVSFPEKLVEMCLKFHGIDNIDLVLDPFMGNGTTAVVCKKLGLDYMGFETDKETIAIANERLRKTEV